MQKSKLTLLVVYFLLFSGTAIAEKMIFVSKCDADQVAVLEGEKPLTFKVVSNKVAVGSGATCSGALLAFLKMIKAYPHIAILKVKNLPGSVDDDINLKLGRKIHQYKLEMQSLPNAIIASGGLDLFLAGTKRRLAPGVKIGVHSWAALDDGNIIKGSSLPKEHKEHQKYIAYYKDIGINPSFYWFTMTAKPNGPQEDMSNGDDMHWMSAKEISQYKLVTP